jgi:hypothetical protein
MAPSFNVTLDWEPGLRISIATLIARSGLDSKRLCKATSFISSFSSFIP